MPRRPLKPPFSAGRVVKSALLLGDELKLLWLEHVALDGDEGAFIGAGQMSQRVGKSRDVVERGRRELIRLGLLVAGDRARGKVGTYYPRLPEDCTPSLRPSVAEVARLAERLDGHIRRVRSGGTDAATDPATPPPRCRTGAATPAAIADLLPAEFRAQSGGTDDATKTARWEGRGEYSHLPSTEGGETPTSEVGEPVLPNGEKRENSNSWSARQEGEPGPCLGCGTELPGDYGRLRCPPCHEAFTRTAWKAVVP